MDQYEHIRTAIESMATGGKPGGKPGSDPNYPTNYPTKWHF